MLAAHGIIYLNKYHVKILKNTIQRLMQYNIPCDVGMAQLQECMRIITPNDPWIFQENDIGKPHMEEWTNFKMDNI